MKYLMKTAAITLLAPLTVATAVTVSAQDTTAFTPDFGSRGARAPAAGSGEQTYVLTGSHVEAVNALQSPERTLELCNFMLKSGFEPAFPAFNVAYNATVFDLYSLETRASRGEVVNDRVKKVGEAVSCTGDETTNLVVAPGIYLDTPTFPNGVPSARLNQSVEITVDGQTYYALGAGTIATDPNAGGLPYPNFLLLTGGFTLHKVVDDPEPGWEVVGSYTYNTALALPGTPDTAGRAEDGILTLRVSPSGYFVPRYILAGGN